MSRRAASPKRATTSPKGAATRQAILDYAVGLARRIGLEGLTIGRLAEDLKLSKSGVFAHFKSKDALQVQVLEAAAARLVELVLQPALKAPRGEPRLLALLERWLAWASSTEHRGGCLFVAASSELDDRPGPARDRLVQLERDWLDLITNTVRGAVTEGHFRADTDADQIAYDLHSALLGYHYAVRLMKDPKATQRLRTAVERIVAAARRQTRSS